MKVLGFIKEGEHIVTCNCGSIIKFSNKEIISEDKCDVDNFRLVRRTEKSITCKSCNRKIHLR